MAFVSDSKIIVSFDVLVPNEDGDFVEKNVTREVEPKDYGLTGYQIFDRYKPEHSREESEAMEKLRLMDELFPFKKKKNVSKESKERKTIFSDGAGKIGSLNGSKKISKEALADLLLYTYSEKDSKPQKLKSVGNPREYLEKVLNESASEKEIQLFEKVLNGKFGTEEMNQLKKIAEDETIGKKPKEMEGWNIKQINPEIEGIQKIIEMSERIEGGCVYLDTEDSYNTLQRMDKLALIQIADPLQKQVLLIQTHQLNDLEMENVLFGIEQLINKRGIKSFGDSSILGLPLNDIQPFRNKKEKMSLKDATEKNGIYMDKGEQMSNWTNRKLRKSQLFYAAFDAIVLSFL